MPISLHYANENLPDVEHKTIIHPLTDISIDFSGVSKLLKNLKTSKASRSDSIPNIILKFSAYSIAPGLSVKCQLSLVICSLLSDWLSANISSVYKRGDKPQAESYRPIMLTCVSCKILGHIVCRHLMNNLEVTKY